MVRESLIISSMFDLASSICRAIRLTCKYSKIESGINTDTRHTTAIQARNKATCSAGDIFIYSLSVENPMILESIFRSTPAPSHPSTWQRSACSMECCANTLVERLPSRERRSWHQRIRTASSELPPDVLVGESLRKAGLR